MPRGVRRRGLRTAIVGRAVVRRQDQADLRTNATAEEAEKLERDEKEGDAKAVCVAKRKPETFRDPNSESVTKGEPVSEAFRLAETERFSDSATLSDTDAKRFAIAVALVKIEQEKEEEFTDSHSDTERKPDAGCHTESVTRDVTGANRDTGRERVTEPFAGAEERSARRRNDRA